MLGRDVAEGWIVNDLIEDFLIPIHAVDKQAFEHAIKDVLEILERISLCSRLQGLVLYGRSAT